MKRFMLCYIYEKKHIFSVMNNLKLPDIDVCNDLKMSGSISNHTVKDGGKRQQGE